MKLYSFPLSGHAHRAHLFLSLVGADFTVETVALGQGEHKQPPFLAMNIFGQVPVLDDDGIFVADSNAILVYVARKLGREDWYPTDPQGAADVQRWLSVAAGQLAFGPAAARLVTVFGASFDAKEVIARAHALFGVVESHLEGREWLASTGHPTIADVAFYSYAESAPEGNVSLADYPGVRALLDRVRALPGFVPFVETKAGLRGR
ncbi:MAG: glutathione S-transferase [Bradymonadia bacterium]|jgi:glutathione S-transferase